MNNANLLIAADTTAAEADGRGIFAAAADFVTKGVPSAALSGIVSLINTGVFYKNKVFGGDTEELDTAELLDKGSESLGAYYRENRQTLDTLGFVAASFLPGSLAVKGVRLAQAGRAAGAFRYAGFLPARAQETALREGLKLVSSGQSSVFASINSAKSAALAAGFADNVLQAAAFETAAAVALYRAPTLQDESLGDIAWDIAKGTLLGGAIGGAVEGLMTNGIFKNATRLVEKELRKADTLTDLKKLGLGVGDEAFATIDSLLDLTSKQFAKELPFSYRVNGKEVQQTLELGDRLSQQAAKTREKGLEKVQANLSYVLPGDPSVGRGFSKYLVDTVNKMKDAGVPQDKIRHEMGNILWGLKKIEGPGSEEVNLVTDYFTLAAGKHLGMDLRAAMAPGGEGVKYKVIGSFDNAKLGMLGQADVPASKVDAWQLGFDAVLDPKTGRYEINPASNVLVKASPKELDSTVVASVFNVRTGTMLDDMVPYIADVATQNSKLAVSSSHVAAGKQVFKFSVEGGAKQADDALSASARHLWAAENKLRLKDQVIDWDDFAILNKLSLERDISHADIFLRKPDGTVEPLSHVAPFFDDWLAQAKWQKLQQLGDRDHREITAILGTEPQWVERVAGQLDGRVEGIPGLVRPGKSFGERENLILSYNKPDMAGGDFLDGMMNYRNRVNEGRTRVADAVRSVLPKKFADTMPDIDPSAVKTAEASGAGPSLAGFSNPDYSDSLRAGLQATGQWLQNTSTEMKRMALDLIQPSAARILAENSPELGAITAKIRDYDKPLALLDGRIVDLVHAKAVAAKAKDVPETAFNLPVSPDVFEFLTQYQKRHGERVDAGNVLRAAVGSGRTLDPMQLYVPPLDTRKLPYFAFVRSKDGVMFAGDEVSMISARTPEQLKTLADKIERDFGGRLQVLYKGDTEEYFKAKGIYEFGSGLNSANIDSALKKKGIMSDIQPVLEAPSVIEEYVSFIGRSEEQLLRNAVSAKHGQLFAELDWLSSQHSKAAASKFGFVNKFVGKSVDDPFGDYKRLALNISKRADFPIWHQANEFVDALGTKAYELAERTFSSAKAGKITWEEANAELGKVGLVGPFTSQADYFEAQLKTNGNLLRSSVAKANTLLATVGLRLDTANALVNVLSAPLMQAAEVSALRNSLKRDPELLAKLTDMTTVANPATGTRIPSIGKLYSGAMSSFFGDRRKELVARYMSIGAIRDDVQQFHAMLEDLSVLPKLKDASAFAKAVEGAAEKGAKFTGNNFAEMFTRFVSADMMRQLTDDAVTAGRMSVKEQDTFIRIFVNRTQGNYVASQRPILFQGTIGAAISLFQTYSFNLYQQLFRHIENRDVRTLAIMGGLQTSLFGLNGLPMFDAINTHLIGSAHINEKHRDMYSTVVGAVGKEAGDWALYGSLSALPFFGGQSPALYTRGDLNPRHLTILPTSLADIPAISVGTRAWEAVRSFGSQVSAGNTTGDAFLHALEHNGLSRPLAGLAQVLQGESTTSKGALISAHQDLLSVATAARLMGAKPMDEAVALNTRFRMEMYRAADRDKIEKLGVAVKQRIRSGDITEEEVLDFAAEYAARGGRVESYNAAWRRWTKDANQSVINTLMKAHKTAYGQRLSEIMGGDPLGDYVTDEGEQ